MNSTLLIALILVATFGVLTLASGLWYCWERRQKIKQSPTGVIIDTKQKIIVKKLLVKNKALIILLIFSLCLLASVVVMIEGLVIMSPSVYGS
ncbi:hypothetical protein [Spiroplasma chrysopicola]|uniref:Transmembrane protein n=1 Tax=Spiroplasma chrysopicola DF-1 TaxID=1276227 RepID=R4UC27_9MOLU|nr:hypothetical protein [Spiroplasma chrysopicola]AGM25464.1 hypothetical protein SCHRY_v1c08910 [Spiroplasma chrysopicola DF-1]